MAKKKNYFYVGVVMQDGQFRFVTKVDNFNRTCEWNKTEVPYLFSSLEDAQYLALGLNCNGTIAYPIHLNYEIDYPLYKEVKKEEA